MLETVIAAILAVSTPFYQAGTGWVFTGFADEVTIATYVDSGTVEKSGQFLKGWTADVYSGPRKYQNDVVYATKMLKEFDCAERRYRALTVILYSKDGKVIRSFDNKDKDWQGVLDDDDFGHLPMVCGFKKYSKAGAGSNPFEQMEQIRDQLAALQ